MLGIVLGFACCGICFFIAYIIVRIFNRKSCKVLAKIVDFEADNGMISPIFNYEIDGKTYRCVMATLTCIDNQVNREKYINNEQTLYYEKNFPNRVRLSEISNPSIVVPLIFFIGIIMMFVLMFING